MAKQRRTSGPTEREQLEVGFLPPPEGLTEQERQQFEAGRRVETLIQMMQQAGELPPGMTALKFMRAVMPQLQRLATRMKADPELKEQLRRTGSEFLRRRLN